MNSYLILIFPFLFFPVLRKKLASIFNACIEAKNCVTCKHQYTKVSSIIAKITIPSDNQLPCLFDENVENTE